MNAILKSMEIKDHLPVGMWPADCALVHQIAERAYYISQSRGFSPGHQLDDWLQAEAEIKSNGAYL